MKRLTSFIFAVFVIFSISTSVFANSLDLGNFSSFGVEPFFVKNAGKNPVQDGVISTDEYASFHISRFENGLVIANKNGILQNEKTKNANPKQESFLSVDREHIYCALRLSLDTDETEGQFVKKLGYVYPVTVSISLSPGDHPANKCSFWSNTYYFSVENGKCVGVAGDRIARSVEEETVLSLCISNVTDIHRENGFVDPNGVKWTADHYGENAAFSISKGAEVVTAMVEIVIPIGDVLLSVPASERSLVAEQWEKQEEKLCGSLLTQVGFFSNGDRVVLGVATAAPYPFSDEWGSIKDYLDANYKKPKSGSFPLDFLPIPLIFFKAEDPSSKSETDPSLNHFDSEKNPIETSSFGESSFGEAEKAQENKTSASHVTAKSSDILSSQGVSTEEDESIFDSLPEEGENLPEDTEIVYLSQSDEDSSENKGSLLGSVLTALAGVFLFAAMIVLVFFVRERKETKQDLTPKEKKAKKDKKG